MCINAYGSAAGSSKAKRKPAVASGGDGKGEGATRVTGNLSARSRPLAPPQHHSRIAIAGDFPRGAASRHLSTRPVPWQAGGTLSGKERHVRQRSSVERLSDSCGDKTEGG